MVKAPRRPPPIPFDFCDPPSTSPLEPPPPESTNTTPPPLCLIATRHAMRRLSFAGAGAAVAFAIASLPSLTLGFTHNLASTTYCLNSSESRDDAVRRHGIINTKCHQETNTLPMPLSESRWGKAPYLAVLTEPDACTSVARVEDTIRAIDQATLDNDVNLVVIRTTEGSGNESALHKWALLRSLAELKRKRNFLLVVNDDAEIVRKAMSQNITVDGVHVKERNAHLIPSIRSDLEHALTCSFKQNSLQENIIIGTSCHSLESAMRSYQLSPRGPDYLFVGTCYLTQSHPEKQSLDQLEGPTLPGRIKQELLQISNKNKASEEKTSQSTSELPASPVIFAIGGIDEKNCNEPVARFGADGVATIRTVMCASAPREVVVSMKRAMTSQMDV